jgi:TPR repeat protein
VRQNPPTQNNAGAAGTATRTNAPIIHQQSAAEKAEGTKKAVEFQKKRAAEGVASAQYDLGVRYLKGDGVEKNLDEARKWLDASAKQGNSMAAKKLEDLKKEQQ